MENPLRPHDAGLPAIAVTPEVKVALSELQRMLAEDPYLQRMKARLQGAAYLNGYLKRRDILESKMAAARERANSLRKQIRPLNYELERVQRQRQTLLAEYQKPNQKPPKPKHVIAWRKGVTSASVRSRLSSRGRPPVKPNVSLSITTHEPQNIQSTGRYHHRPDRA